MHTAIRISHWRAGARGHPGPRSPIPGHRPPEVNFSLFNGYYVSPLAINNEDGSVELVAGNKDEDGPQKDPTDPRAREYVTTQPSHPLPL